jgi:hypothetical protein
MKQISLTNSKSVHKLNKMQRKNKACDQTKYECAKMQFKYKQALIAKFFPEPQRIEKEQKRWTPKNYDIN